MNEQLVVRDIAVAHLEAEYQGHRMHLVYLTPGQYLPYTLIDHYNPDAPLGDVEAGYQRWLAKARLLACVDFVLGQAGKGTMHVFPALTCATRKPLQRTKEGRIVLSMSNPLYVVDGQTRTETLRELQEHGTEDISAFPVAVQIFEYLGIQEERGLFEDINVTPFKVPGDLTTANEKQMIQTRIDAGLPVRARQRMAIVIEHCIRLLNGTPDNIWYQRISDASVPAYAQPVVNGKRIVRTPAFDGTLNPIGQHIERPIKNQDLTEPELGLMLYELVADYWSAMAIVEPEVFVGNEAFVKYNIQSKHSVMVFHAVLLPMYEYAKKLMDKREIEREAAFVELMSRMPIFSNPNYWDYDTDERLLLTVPAIRKATVQRLTGELTTAAVKQLRLKSISS